MIANPARPMAEWCRTIASACSTSVVGTLSEVRPGQDANGACSGSAVEEMHGTAMNLDNVGIGLRIAFSL